LAVTFDFSASALIQYGNLKLEPAALPTGVLELFNDGLLTCSIDVGGAVTGGSCPVTYSALGAHTVTVTYVSGEASGTETETVQIKPSTTRTTMALDGPMSCTVVGGPTVLESCSYSAQVTTTDQHGAVPPQGGQTILIHTTPTEEFTPAVFPTNAGPPAELFGAPVLFTLRREHNSEGWRCSISEGPRVDYFFALDWFESFQCGTSMTAAASYEDNGHNDLWTASASEPVAVVF